MTINQTYKGYHHFNNWEDCPGLERLCKVVRYQEYSVCYTLFSSISVQTKNYRVIQCGQGMNEVCYNGEQEHSGSGSSTSDCIIGNLRFKSLKRFSGNCLILSSAAFK